MKVQFKGAIPNCKPIIHAARTEPLEKILEMIRHYNVEILVKDKTIYVSPNPHK
ncbi:hypothetical protein [Paraflavitalea speifideaquila]|uniref:hypothetical protein n=1 Tax=Paraflavitalea speifideaquila TaxID=3076558 RepID=UPI00331307AF